MLLILFAFRAMSKMRGIFANEFNSLVNFMIFKKAPTQLSALRQSINNAYLVDETEHIEVLLPSAELRSEVQHKVIEHTRRLVEAVRAAGKKQGGIDAFIREYDLSSEEGVVLMCLAEALLRIPDNETADLLIRDKLSFAQWDQHLGHSHSLFVNASTWGLMLTGSLVQVKSATINDARSFLMRSIARVGEPVVRGALRRAMRILGHQFVLGATIEEALARGRAEYRHNYRFSYDMLGETAITAEEAGRYFTSYRYAIETLAKLPLKKQSMFSAPSISVKLSALHPRYEFSQRDRVLQELIPRLRELAIAAKQGGIALTIDAEESERLDLSLDIFEAVFFDPELADWPGLGIAVQAYQKRSIRVISWLIALAKKRNSKIPIRLVKGAYWDTEIKHAQEQGHSEYPVFTRKVNTDVSYLACARHILEAADVFYPQFATHNARTLATIYAMADGHPGYEFQRLHGMGDNLYNEIIADEQMSIPCRIYAPVGCYEDLLPYLVRRLLENGANTSFVNSIEDENIPVEVLIADPVLRVASLADKPHPNIVLPKDLYAIGRENSSGINFCDVNALTQLAQGMALAAQQPWLALPIVNGEKIAGNEIDLFSPANNHHQVGKVVYATVDQTQQALAGAQAAAWAWNTQDIDERVSIINRASDLMNEHRAELAAMIVSEGGRTVVDAMSEIREAIDFCRYYASRAKCEFGSPMDLAGPTGEHNVLSLGGRGVFVCISPWNFPLAIFVGQVVAALAAGNTVLAKPASQTPLVAMRAVELFHQAGVPGEVLHFIPASGKVLYEHVLSDQRVAGVAFTGSLETARDINVKLALRDGAIVPFIAETGGLNVMIVDSSAHPEQAVSDIVQSAFNSAGQRCSALRVLFLQEDIAPRMMQLLSGAMKELCIGDPGLLSTDVGPVINMAAMTQLNKHVDYLDQVGQLIYQVELPDGLTSDNFFAPRMYEIPELTLLDKEVFGPILHVVRFNANQLDEVVDTVNQSGYGLTLGIHSRIEATIKHICARAKVGNVYVNRNMIGAVVGVQPFGGQGLSGTGPKAGGPFYLHRFALEQTLSNNISAIGGNTQLLAMEDGEFLL